MDRIRLLNAGVTVAVGALARTKAVARRGVATAIMVRLHDDFAWALLDVSLAGDASGMIIEFFSSVSAHVSTTGRFDASVSPISAGGKPP